MIRDDIRKALKRVVLITLATLAVAYVLTFGVVMVIGFQAAVQQFTLTTFFTLVLMPAAAFPLVIMSDRMRALKEELETLLRIDGLTELPNRRAFFEKASEVFKRDNAISMMMIDVDFFKSVNDRFGHDTGDRVLRSVAQSIQQVVSSAAGTGAAIAARIGGEEFAVLVEGLDAAAADRLADELVLKVRQQPVRDVAHAINVTVSAGVAHRSSGATPDKVLRAADNACYRAKRLGRNQWRDADTQDDAETSVTKTPSVTAA